MVVAEWSKGTRWRQGRKRARLESMWNVEGGGIAGEVYQKKTIAGWSQKVIIPNGGRGESRKVGNPLVEKKKTGKNRGTQ